MPKGVNILQVAREADFGNNDCVFYGRTHLGGLLNAGDIALGYDLSGHVGGNDDLEGYQQRGYQCPDFILVRKSYDEHRQRRREKGGQRIWKLRHMQMAADDGPQLKRKPAVEAGEADRERFLEVCSSLPNLVLLSRD